MLGGDRRHQVAHRVGTERSVLITGCSSGIGRCLALGLADRGYRVLATVRDAKDTADLAGRGLQSLPLDLTSSQSISTAVAEVLDRTGGELYALINNAGYGQVGLVEDLSRDVLRRQLETNLLGTHELTTRLIPVFRERGAGRIIQISSVLGRVCLPYRGAYQASKYALEALSDTLRLELAGTGIGVSLIEPGPIKSRFRSNALRYYEANIDSRASAQRERYRHVEQRLHSDEEPPFTLGPDAVLKKVVHALESPRPRTRYPVTVPAHLLPRLARLLPARWFDRIVLRFIDR